MVNYLIPVRRLNLIDKQLISYTMNNLKIKRWYITSRYTEDNKTYNTITVDTHNPKNILLVEIALSELRI